MDPNQARGRSSLQGNNNQRSPAPSPHQYHGALDPNLDAQAFGTGKFQAAPFSPPYLDSTQPQPAQALNPDTNFYANNQFNQTAFQENQWSDQPLDQSFADDEFMYPNMSNTFQPGYSLDNPFNTNQQSNVNPAELSSPHGPAPSNMLSPDHTTSPPQPPSPTSTQSHYYTPQHSRHQSLDPASAAYPQGEWQGMEFQGHRRLPSEHSDISSNSASPYLAQNDTFEPYDGNPSPLVHPQQDANNTFGIDSFSLADRPHPSPGHSPYMSPRLLPQQGGLGLGPEVMLGQQQVPGSGQEIYPSRPEGSYPQVPAMHGRNLSSTSDMGQADQFPPPSINIEPAPVSRQQSFEIENKPVKDALSPPTRNRGRSKSDPNLNRPISRSSSPAARGGAKPHDTHSARSLSPGLSVSRDSSPGPSGRVDKRRSSTSAINPSRDYILDLADPSRPSASTQSQTNRVQKHPATFQCGLCPKRFTRAYNLRSHLRTHTDERPFVCTVCGKAFARQHDRKRHEGLHSGEKKFVCRGDLGSGANWGCGRRFARADALGRHFRSEAGRVCIKPLLDEEAAERERSRMMEAQQSQAAYPVGSLQPVQPTMTYMDPSGHGGGNFALPAALLAQYPQLGSIDWSIVSQTEDPGELSDVGVGGSGYDPGSGYFEDGEVDDGEYTGGGGMTYNPSGQAGW